MGLLPTLLFLVVAVVCVSCKTQPLPSYIASCYRNDPNFNECAAKNGQAALPSLAKGDRKYRIVTLDPLQIDELVVGRGNGSVSVDLKFNHVNIVGFGNTQIKSTNFDLDKQVITIKMFDPSVEVTGDYSGSGRVLILPINGKGDFNITLENCDFTYILKYKLTKKADGLDYLVPTDYSLTGRPTKAYIRLDNLFNGNKALSDNLNRVLNDNWSVLIDELGPPLLEGVGIVLQQTCANALRNIPFDVIFPIKS